MKRKIKVWGKIKIYEASAVGIPSYPDAHLNTSFSLIKALSNANLKPRTGFVEEGEDVSHEVNTEETETMKDSEIKKQETSEESEEEKPEEKKEEEKPEEKSAGTSEEKSEESEEEEESDDAEKKSDISETIAKAIKDGIKDGIKELVTERGLVDKQTPVEKSLGEMALDKGLFQLK